MHSIDTLMTLFAEVGGQQYGREAVSQLQHALQCASLAEQAGAAPTLVAAALLHDVGHLLPRREVLADGWHGDDRHETVGERFLADSFGEAVTVPVRLHVPAKRYLCAVEPGYIAGLSPASVRSLELQGGPFTADEAERFLEQPFAADAVALRRWDDLAKDPDAAMPDLEHFRPVLEVSLRPVREP